MAARRITYWHSVQSPYCYFLIDRLLGLAAEGVEIEVRPVLGLVLRMPEMTRDRGPVEDAYFQQDVARTAAFLGLPCVSPDPSPIVFEPGSNWVAAAEQPRIERLHRLFVGAVRAGHGLAFLDTVGRALWDGSAPGWDQGPFLADAMARMGLSHDTVLAELGWAETRAELDRNHKAMLATGHWGVPLMAVGGEPFYGQDRFDQLRWRLGLPG